MPMAAAPAVSFEYGLTTAYGTTVAATPATVTGTTATAVSATLADCCPGTTYHYPGRRHQRGRHGDGRGHDLHHDHAWPRLSGLTLSSGTLAPAFASINTSYLATVPYAASSITVTPVPRGRHSTVRVNGSSGGFRHGSGPLNLAVGNNRINVVVTAADGINTRPIP